MTDVSNKIHRAGRRFKVEPPTKRELKILVDEKYSKKEIAEAYGISLASVYNILGKKYDKPRDIDLKDKIKDIKELILRGETKQSIIEKADISIHYLNKIIKQGLLLDENHIRPIPPPLNQSEKGLSPHLDNQN